MNIINIKLFPSNKHFLLTQDGLNDIKINLDSLRKERTNICNNLLKMDQKEKIEYILANDIIKLLEINEEKMMKISEIIQRSEIAEKDSNPTNVKIGSVVDLEFGDKTLKYTLVSTLEADPSANKISEKSPLGQALLGKQKSEIVKLITPKGLALRYKLLSIT